MLIQLGIFALLVMIYWSSNLTEQRLIRIESKLENGNGFYKNGYQKVSQTASTSVDHSDPSLENILEGDPFYAKTLPELLGPDFSPHGTFLEANLGKPKNLHPFTGWSDVNQWISLCSDTVAHQKFGIYETFAPGLAVRMEEREREDLPVKEYWVFLRDNIYWEPLSESNFDHAIQLADHFKQRHQVTAHDFKFYHDALMNPFVQNTGAVTLRNFYSEIEEIEVIDDTTFVVRWKATEFNGKLHIPYIAKQLTGGLRPFPSFLFQYFPDGSKIIEEEEDNTYRTNSVWAQNFSEHWAKNVIPSCGPWAFERMSDKQISFFRNDNFWEPLGALATERKIALRENPDSVWQDFKAGHLDSYTLQPDQLVEWENFRQSKEYKAQVKSGNDIQRLDYQDLSYAYIGWNEATPYFSSTEVRRAMTLAIDRQRIIDTILNGLGVQITGPFSPSSPSYNQDIQPIPFSPSQAKRILEKEGWFDTDGDGIREKVINGNKVPFRFTLTFYVKNPTSKAVCSYISTALKQIGIQCHLHGIDLSDLSAAYDGKTFDAIFLGWALGSPPEEPRQLWHSSGAEEKGSSNAVGFKNAEADQIIETLRFESDKEKRNALYHRFHEIIHEQQPYTFLYTPIRPLLGQCLYPCRKAKFNPWSQCHSTSIRHFLLNKA